jgi:hypothetical protein
MFFRTFSFLWNSEVTLVNFLEDGKNFVERLQGKELTLPRLRSELFLIRLVFELVLVSSIGCFGLHL